jgi:hypothetical protein
VDKYDQLVDGRLDHSLSDEIKHAVQSLETIQTPRPDQAPRRSSLSRMTNPHPDRVPGAPTTHFDDEALSLLHPQLTLPLLPDTSRCSRSRGVTGYLRWKASARNKRLVTTALTSPAP